MVGGSKLCRLPREEGSTEQRSVLVRRDWRMLSHRSKRVSRGLWRCLGHSHENTAAGGGEGGRGSVRNKHTIIQGNLSSLPSFKTETFQANKPSYGLHTMQGVCFIQRYDDFYLVILGAGAAYKSLKARYKAQKKSGW